MKAFIKESSSIPAKIYHKGLPYLFGTWVDDVDEEMVLETIIEIVRLMSSTTLKIKFTSGKTKIEIGGGLALTGNHTLWDYDGIHYTLDEIINSCTKLTILDIDGNEIIRFKR